MLSFRVASSLLLVVYVARCWGKDCYGTDCKPCGHCFSGACNNKTGECPSGCKANFRSPLCQECQDGWWNETCSERCGYCESRSCNKSNGACNSCISGKNPPLCKDDCKPHYFGPGCKQQCGKCSSPIPCDLVTGKCPDGCLDGFTGQNCKTRCPKGTAGPKCVHLCRNCEDSECDASGNCTLGCNAGFSGDKCEEGGHMMFKAYVIGGSVGCCALILLIVPILLIIRACGKNKRKKHALLTMHHIQKKLSDQARFTQVEPDGDLDTVSTCHPNPEAEHIQSTFKARANTCPDMNQTAPPYSSGDVKLAVTMARSCPGSKSPTLPIPPVPLPGVRTQQDTTTPQSPTSSQDSMMVRCSTNSNYVIAINSPGFAPYNNMAFSHNSHTPNDCPQNAEKEPEYANAREILSVRNMAKIFELNEEKH
ncbi:scavenger receptor class F member 2-like isoform X4 [Haliotis cracherodii]|uniref:scavenger receptor class F member 2-like isoform X2 n=1 Tax=Haliotis cracherodii TaxID=6455 RepID=UPI0039EBD00E